MSPVSRFQKKIVEKIALAAAWIAIIAVIFYVTIPLGNIQAKHFDVILVLGYPTKPDGTPSPEQRERVLEAVRQYQAGVAPFILVSGGAAHNQFVEADAMAALAESFGVQSTAIVKEPHAHNTIENVEYSTQIMRARGWDSVEAITSAAHARRGSLILMHSPIPVNWYVKAAPWPAEDSAMRIAAHYTFEIFACAEMRIVGFRETIPHQSVLQRTPDN